MGASAFRRPRPNRRPPPRPPRLPPPRLPRRRGCGAACVPRLRYCSGASPRLRSHRPQCGTMAPSRVRRCNARAYTRKGVRGWAGAGGWGGRVGGCGGGAAGRAGFGRWRAQRHLRREVVEAARGLDVGVEVGLVHFMARRGAALVEMIARVLAGAIGEAIDVHLIAHLLREHDRRQPRRWHLRTHHACTHVCMERTRYR